MSLPTTLCETTRCSNYSLQRQLVARCLVPRPFVVATTRWATTGCDVQPLQLSVSLSFRTILSPPTLAGLDAIVAFNLQGFNYQFSLFVLSATRCRSTSCRVPPRNGYCFVWLGLVFNLFDCLYKRTSITIKSFNYVEVYTFLHKYR